MGVAHCRGSGCAQCVIEGLSKFGGVPVQERSKPSTQAREPFKDGAPQLFTPSSKIATQNRKPDWDGIHDVWEGRPPVPFMVGIAGGTASGKSSVTKAVMRQLESRWGQGTVASFSQDSFYKTLTLDQLKDVASYNFDHPDALDWEESLAVTRKLRAGETALVPEYDYKEHRRQSAEKATMLDGSKLRVIIVESILLFYNKEMRDLFDLRIFVDVASDTRLCRRVRRDVRDRGRDVAYVLAQYTQTVKPSFEAFCQPTKKYAHLIMPRGVDNEKGLQVIIDAVQRHAASETPAVEMMQSPASEDAKTGW